MKNLRFRRSEPIFGHSNLTAKEFWVLPTYNNPPKTIAGASTPNFSTRTTARNDRSYARPYSSAWTCIWIHVDSPRWVTYSPPESHWPHLLTSCCYGRIRRPRMSLEFIRIHLHWTQVFAIAFQNQLAQLATFERPKPDPSERYENHRLSWFLIWVCFRVHFGPKQL